MYLLTLNKHDKKFLYEKKDIFIYQLHLDLAICWKKRNKETGENLSIIKTKFKHIITDVWKKNLPKELLLLLFKTIEQYLDEIFLF